MATLIAGQLSPNGLSAIPTFFPIDTSGTTDVSKVPIFNTMRGDIVPAEIDRLVGSPTFGQIINHPTPFYIFCASKIVNTNNVYETLPRVQILSPEAYIQFGLTQGNGDVFPATNAKGDNKAYKNQFTLTNFSKAFTSGVFETNEEESAGLLVPVYCTQNNFEYDKNVQDRAHLPSFIFFRADVFWDSTIDGNVWNAKNQIPDKPINYQSPNFPSPKGKTFDEFFLLASFYSLAVNNNDLTGTWSQFMPFQLIAVINAPVGGANYFNNGPAAALVSISFNDPYDGIGTKSEQNVNFYPVNILRSSTIYTVYYMDQYLNFTGSNKGSSNFIQKYYVPFDSADSYTNQNEVTRNYGFPLNFIYQVGADTYSKTQGFETFYQADNIVTYNNYLGTMTQWGTGYEGYPGAGLNPASGTAGWNIGTLSNFFRNNFAYNFTTLTERGVSSATYVCNCNSSPTKENGVREEYVNNFCNVGCVTGTAPPKDDGYPGISANSCNDLKNGIYITGTNTRVANSLYYGAACSTIPLGTFNFSMFQFVPINYFNVPRKGAVPPITSPQDFTSTAYQGEVAITGEIGVPATFGPGPTGLSGTNVPVYTPGPTGAGLYSISYPFNTQTGASNNWPTLGEPSNRVQNIDLTNTLESWIANPANFECPKLISSQTYCGFQDYYHSLLGYFYDKPQELSPNAACGDQYVPPIDNIITSSIKYSPYGCTGTKICVPNYDFLNAVTDPSKKAFYCQDPEEAVPYPESTNGFNNTNSYTIENFNSGLLNPPWLPYPPFGGRIPLIQPKTYTPITWDNLNNYSNLVPTQSVPSNIPSFSQVPFIPNLNSVNPQTGKTQAKGNTPVYIVIAIIAVIIFVFAIVFFVYYSAKSKNKDMYNPHNFQYYNRVI